MDNYDYVITKPELNDETLSHFLGGAHKYINKYMGKNGKWVYVYNKAKKGLKDAKNKAYDAMVRYQRKRLGFKAEDVSVQRKNVYKHGRRYLVGIGYKGDDGRPRSTGLTSGNKGYTRSLGSVVESRNRALKARLKREQETRVTNKTNKNGVYRPTSRKKKVGEGTGSVKIRGTKGLGLNVKANLMKHRVNAFKTENAIKERERNRKAAIKARKNRKAK